MATTRLLDNESTNLTEIINKIMTPVEDHMPYMRIHTEKYFDDNQSKTFGGRSIEFNYISFNYDYVKPGKEPIEDRTSRKDGFIIVYYNGTSVNYIINRNSDAKTILRLFIGYTGRNEIVINNPDIESDFFVWCIRKVFKSENILSIDEGNDDNTNKIAIDSIKGFKGDSADTLTKVSADGESVMNIISTLSFFLESSLLNQIKMEIEYKKHENIEIILNTKDTVSITLKEYDGEYDKFLSQKLTAYLYLLIYLEVIPNLDYIYRLELNNDDWGISQYKEFLGEVAKKLQDNVAKKIEIISKSVN